MRDWPRSFGNERRIGLGSTGDLSEVGFEECDHEEGDDFTGDEAPVNDRLCKQRMRDAGETQNAASPRLLPASLVDFFSLSAECELQNKGQSELSAVFGGISCGRTDINGISRMRSETNTSTGRLAWTGANHACPQLN